MLGSPDLQLSLTVTRPNGGEVLEGGATFLLEWTSTGEIPDVKLEYSPDGGQAWTDIIASTPNSGSLFWAVPTAETDNALVRISDVADPAVTDESDSLFSIVISSLAVIAPNGGESWTGGDTQTIEWSSTGAVDNVQIEYSVDNGDTWTEIVASTANSGTYDWTVPDVQSGSALVRISNVAGVAPSDVSDAVFELVGSSLTVTAPNGGESWGRGATQIISWTYTGNVDSVKIEYSIDNGATWTEVTPPVLNFGSFDWTLPDVESDSALVRVSDADDGLPSDMSDAVFSIASTQLTVIVPNGGEYLFVGSTYSLSWASTGAIDEVKLEYSGNASLSWTEIAAGATNTSSYAWTVPNGQTSSALIHISDADDGDPLDVSDNVFDIFRTCSDTAQPKWRRKLDGRYIADHHLGQRRPYQFCQAGIQLEQRRLLGHNCHGCG